MSDLFFVRCVAICTVWMTEETTSSDNLAKCLPAKSPNEFNRSRTAGQRRKPSGALTECLSDNGWWWKDRWASSKKPGLNDILTWNPGLSRSSNIPWNSPSHVATCATSADTSQQFPLQNPGRRHKTTKDPFCTMRKTPLSLMEQLWNRLMSSKELQRPRRRRERRRRKTRTAWSEHLHTANYPWKRPRLSWTSPEMKTTPVTRIRTQKKKRLRTQYQGLEHGFSRHPVYPPHEQTDAQPHREAPTKRPKTKSERTAVSKWKTPIESAATVDVQRTTYAITCQKTIDVLRSVLSRYLPETVDG